MNERGVYRSRARLAANTHAAIGAIAVETKRAHTNAVLIGVGVIVGLVGWRTQDTSLGMIALGASGGIISSGITGLLLDREGG